MCMTKVSASDFFTDEGKLSEPLVYWLMHTFQYEEAVIRKTKFKPVAKLPYDAHTFYKTVRYYNPNIPNSPTANYSYRNWLNIIAHEMYHRQEIGNNWFSAAAFGISYGWHWVKNWLTGKHPYYDNPHEVRAFNTGCNSDSKVNVFLARFPDTEKWLRCGNTEDMQLLASASKQFKNLT